MGLSRIVTAATTLLLLAAACGCAHTDGPSPDLRLRKVVLYQSGIGYFERTGYLPDGKLRMKFRDREVDDVLKSLVVVEEGLDAAREKPSTVSVRLEDRAAKKGDDDGASSSLDLVLSRQVARRMAIAYEVPTAVWKATYRVILPDARAADHAGMALVQAWALIDNASDEDWDGVQISLATGAPLSFSTDLRTTQFVERPTVSTAQPMLANGAVVSENARRRGEDRDGDGVPDDVDKCPDASGASDQDGCPEGRSFVRVDGSEVRVLQSIDFERDSDEVPARASAMLDEVARIIKDSPQLDVQVEGHASADEKDPWVVAARRAGAVRAALESRGVTAKLAVQSFGDTRPIAEATTEDGRRRNRRVQFHVLAAKGKEDPRGHAGGRLEMREAVARSGGQGAAPHQVSGAVRYDIADPVTIARHSSNLVTIVNRYVPGEEVLLYRPDPSVPSSATHPFRAARLDNRGGLELQAGSVAIFSGGTFVGEGLLAHLNPGETTLIPYAVDGATDVRASSEESRRPARIVAIARGLVTVEDEESATTRYEANVGQQAPGRLVVRHARRAGWEASNLPPGTDATPDAYTVALPVRAGQKSVLLVEERRTTRREVGVADTAAATLAAYLQGSSFPPDVQKRMHDVVALRSDIDAREQEIAAMREALTDAGARAGELRASLRAVERTPRAAALQKQLLDRLAAATRDVEEQSVRLAEKATAQSLARMRLAEELRDLRLGDAK
jgi:outer membrane protein OmpA-like peptidoglycan-associated protein